MLFREFGGVGDPDQQLHLEFANDRHGAAAPVGRAGRPVTGVAAR
jgi:hypothetical protein